MSPDSFRRWADLARRETTPEPDVAGRVLRRIAAEGAPAPRWEVLDALLAAGTAAGAAFAVWAGSGIVEGIASLEGWLSLAELL